MRKCVILLLVLSLLSVGGILLAHGAVDDLSDRVSFTEEVHSGELSAAEGLVVNVKTQMERNLFWETEYPLGGEPKTDFAFYQTDQHEPYRREGYGMGLDFPSGYGWSSSRGTDYENPDEEDMDQMGSDYVLLPMLQAVSRNTAKQSEHTEVVRVADYFDYLPLTFYLDDDDVFHVVEEDGYQNVYPVSGDRYGEGNYGLSSVLGDYFRIPTPEDMLLEITMYKDADGLITELDVNNAYEETDGVSPPNFDIHNAVTEAGCYFTFYAQCYDVEGNSYPLDTSQIEGGYGVYLLPYTDEYDLVQTTAEEGVKYVDFKNFRCVYPFESENAVPEDLHVLEEEKQLLLTTQEERTMYLNVIDRATGERVQKLALMEQADEVGWGLRKVWYEDGFLVHLDYDNRFTLCERTETGYVVRITGEIAMDKNMDNALYSDQVAVAYDGERLAIVFSLYLTEPYYDCASSIGVLVYDDTGLLYSGVHISSLDIGSTEYSQRVTLQEKDPITVRWE